MALIQIFKFWFNIQYDGSGSLKVLLPYMTQLSADGYSLIYNYFSESNLANVSISINLRSTPRCYQNFHRMR